MTEDLDDFWKRLENRLASEDDWSDLLTDYTSTVKVRQVLTDKLMDLQGQLARNKSRHDEFRQECFRDGKDGKARWFKFEGEYSAWRKRALHLMGLVNGRLRRVKFIEEQQRPGAGAGTSIERAEKIATRELLHQLTQGVYDHLKQTHASRRPKTAADEVLWDLLDDLEIPVGKGTLTLFEWIEDGRP